MNAFRQMKENKIMRLGFAMMISLGATWAIPSMVQMEGVKLGFTNSIWSVFAWFLLVILLNRIFLHPFEQGKKRWIIPILFSAGFVISMVFGTALDLEESVPFNSLAMWLSVFYLTFLFAIIVRYLFDIFVVPSQPDSIAKKQSIQSYITTFLLIFLCYIPVFLAVYPGFFVYDAQDELMQVITRNFTTHHPLVHVLLLGGIIQIGNKLSGSYNVGIACYTIFQMLIMSGIFAYTVECLKRSGVSKKIKIATALYFGLFPVIVMFSLCSAKDGLFTALLLLTVLMLRELIKEPMVFLKSKAKMAVFCLAAAGMMLLRHNAYYAFLVFIPCLLVFMRKKPKVLLKVGILVALSLVVYTLVNDGLTMILHAEKSGNQEMLTVPIQQMARVYKTEQNNLSEEDKETLYEILPKEALERYVPKISDGVKIHFNNEAFSKNPGKYSRLWAKWGLENPFTYLNAWFMTSYGFWYPDTVIDVYRGNSVFTYTYEDSSYFGYEVEQPGTRESKIPWLAEVYRQMSLEIAQQKIPVLSMLFSPGFLFWLCAFLLCYMGYQGERRRWMAYVLPALIWLTVILGPTYLVRYVVFLWVLLPVLLQDVWETQVR